MKKPSFRRIFFIYSTFYLLIILGLVGLAGYYLFQNQKKEVLSRISELKDNVSEQLGNEVLQASRSLRVLKTSIEVFSVNSSERSLHYFSKIVTQVIQERGIQYNAYFAFEKPWAQKYFKKDGFIQVTHRNHELYGTPSFYDSKTFVSRNYTNPNYQKDLTEVWYQIAKTNDQIQISAPYFDKTYMKQWLITVAYGLYDKGQFQGMVGVDILVDELAHRLNEIELGSSGGVLWIDKRTNQILSKSSKRLQGFIGAADQFKIPSFMSKQDKAVWQNVLNESSSIAEVINVNGKKYAISSASIDHSPWQIVVYQDYDEAFAPMFQKFYRICLLAIFGIILLVHVAIHLHRAIARPLEELIESVKLAIRSSRGNKLIQHRQLISATGYTELHRISKLFNILLRTIDRNTQRQFDLIEEERIRSLQQAKMASLGQMASGIAHEINNPLSILNGRLVKAEKFLMANPPDVEAATTTVRSIEQIVFRIAKIVRGLRHFSREASKDPFELKSSREIIEETLDLCAQRFQNHGIRVYTTGLDDELILECQTVQISQVILNLLNNSFDAIIDLVEKWVRIDVGDGGESVVIRITDSGKGIPLDVAQKIMDPFFTTKEVGKGTGLGLSLSRGIIEYHQGQLFLDVDCENTSFVIRLPKFRNYKIKSIESQFPDWK